MRPLPARLALAGAMLLSGSNALASESAANLANQAGAGAVTRSIMLGAGVLVATQLILVATAVVWYVRSQRGSQSPDAGTEPLCDVHDDTL